MAKDTAQVLKSIEKMLVSKETSILQEGVKKLLAMQIRDRSLDFEAAFSKGVNNAINSLRPLFTELINEVKSLKNSISGGNSQTIVNQDIKKITLSPKKSSDSYLDKALNNFILTNENLLSESMGMLSNIIPNTGYSNFRDEQQEQTLMYAQVSMADNINKIYEFLISKPVENGNNLIMATGESGGGMLSSILGGIGGGALSGKVMAYITPWLTKVTATFASVYTMLKNPAWIKTFFNIGKTALGITAITLGTKAFYDGILKSQEILGRKLDLSQLADWGEAIKLGFSNIVSSISGISLEKIYTGITDFQNYISNLWKTTIGDRIAPVLENYQAIMDEYGGYITRIATFVYDIPSYLTQGFGWLLDKLGVSFGKTIQKVGEYINLGAAMQKVLAHPLDFLQTIVGNIYKYVAGIAIYLGSWGGFREGFTKSFTDALKDAETDFGSKYITKKESKELEKEEQKAQSKNETYERKFSPEIVREGESPFTITYSYPLMDMKSQADRVAEANNLLATSTSIIQGGSTSVQNSQTIILQTVPNNSFENYRNDIVKDK